MLNRKQIVDVLSEVYDPEIPLDLITLGLIYGIKITADDDVVIQMTLTFPGCPMIDDITAMVRDAVQSIPEVSEVDIEMVWLPPWDTAMISSDGREELGLSLSTDTRIKIQS